MSTCTIVVQYLVHVDMYLEILNEPPMWFVHVDMYLDFLELPGSPDELATNPRPETRLGLATPWNGISGSDNEVRTMVY